MFVLMALCLHVFVLMLGFVVDMAIHAPMTIGVAMAIWRSMHEVFVRVVATELHTHTHMHMHMHMHTGTGGRASVPKPVPDWHGVRDVLPQTRLFRGSRIEPRRASFIYS